MRRQPLAALLLVAAAASCGRDRAPEIDLARVPSPSGKAPATFAADAYGVRPVEKTAIEAFLKAHTDLRLSTDADAKPPDVALTRLYGVYHPFFLRGDVNDDGLIDVVTAFVRRDSPASTPWFSVVVFVGRASGGFEPGVYLERDISLANGDLSIDRDSIIVTPDTSDDPNRRYRWDAARKQFALVGDEDEPAEAPPLTRTGFALRVPSFELGARPSRA